MPDITRTSSADLIADKPILAVIRIPENPTGDVWLTLFEAMCLYYAEPPLGGDRESLEQRMAERKSACLAEYGLHLNV